MYSQLPDTQTLDDVVYSQNEEEDIWGVLYSTKYRFKTLVMTKKEYTVGRLPSCDIILEKEMSMSESDSSVASDALQYFGKIRIGVPQMTLNTFSKLHFTITKDVAVVFLNDHSSNGTYVNGKLVGKGKKVILQSNDQISLAHQDYKVYVFVDNSVTEVVNYPSEIKDNFVVSRSLGKGSYGEVLMVFQKRTSERLAMKVVEKKSLDPSHDSITNEVTILKALDHPCVINILNVVDSPEKVFIFLPLMEGGDLFAKIQRHKKLDEDVSKFFFYQITKAVQYLHRKGIAHRDLKPENILLSTDKDSAIVKLSDFGLSRFFNQQRVMRTLCGTPSYVAPEVLETQGCGYYSNQIDVWSMGVVLYVCLSGNLPFNNERKDLTLQEQIRAGSYCFPARNWQGVSPNAIDLIKKMMTVNPNSRIAVNMIPYHNWFQDEDLTVKLRVVNLFEEENLEPPSMKRRRTDY